MVSTPVPGPEVLLIFIGHSADAIAAVELLHDMESELQTELDRMVGLIPGGHRFKRVKLWSWTHDAAAGSGGQDRIINPYVDRADIAVFLFNSRVGEETWNELERCRDRATGAPPLIVLFPRKLPDNVDVGNVDHMTAWADLLRRKRALIADWGAAASRAVTPLEDYTSKEHLEDLLREHLKAALAGLLRPTPATPTPVTPSNPQPEAKKLLGDYPHLTYDRRPVLIHDWKELDANRVEDFLQRPLSRDQIRSASRTGRLSQADQLQLLGCLCDGRPTLGAFLCFAPTFLLADKFDSCSLQLVTFGGLDRVASCTGHTAPRGNLLDLFDYGMNWLRDRSGLRLAGATGSLHRDDLEIPEIVLREVLANALVHRDYESAEARDQPTRIEVYLDRVEITSFGRLAPAVPVELLNSNPGEVTPIRRNPIIARIFQHMTHVELFGSGVRRMWEEMTRVTLAPPRILHDAERGIVRVILARPTQPEPAAPPPVPPSRRRRVYVSSTMRDLPEHRKLVIEAIQRMGYLPIAQENYGADDSSPHERILQEIETADLFLGIYGSRLGYTPDQETLSITEQEFRHARGRGIPTLAFFMDRDHPQLPVPPEEAHRVERFKKFVQGEQVSVAYFRSPLELRERVLLALAQAIPQVSPSRAPRPLYISYQGTDALVAGRLYDRLCDAYGPSAVFLDKKSVRAGDRWADAVQQRLLAAEVVLVLIGTDWAPLNPQSAYLQSPDSWVRREVEEVLKSTNKLVIPLLIDNAPMPGVDQLPASLRQLANLKAMRVGSDSFHRDVDQLLRVIEAHES